MPVTEELLRQHPHRRWNPLRREWVLVSPHRTERPWQGQMEKRALSTEPQYAKDCYLCPGNTRACGHVNPPYTSTFVFENDYAALKPGTPSFSSGAGALLRAESEPGLCRVVCFDPRHDLTIARMSASQLQAVIDVWTQQYRELGAVDWIRSVQIFENRGEMMGASNPHPHCQIWSNATLPNEWSAEQAAFDEYRGCLLCDYAKLEQERAERIVVENEHFLAVVPFWAVWPFETLLLAKPHVTALDELDAPMQRSLADAMKRLTTKYDNLFEIAFPYSMGFHQRPSDGQPHREWHFHAHYYPPLLRSATVRKFMVGYEMLGTPQRDITPESAAERLRQLSELHYTETP